MSAAMLRPLQLRLAPPDRRGIAGARHAGRRARAATRCWRRAERSKASSASTCSSTSPPSTGSARQPRFEVVYHFYSTTHFVRVRAQDAGDRSRSDGRLAGLAVRLGRLHGARVPRHVRHRLPRQSRPAPDPALRGLRRPPAAQGLSEAAGAAARPVPRNASARHGRWTRSRQTSPAEPGPPGVRHDAARRHGHRQHRPVAPGHARDGPDHRRAGRRARRCAPTCIAATCTAASRRSASRTPGTTSSLTSTA